MSLSTQNHYVPQWYQRRFHSNDVDEHKVYYLDLKPDKVKRQNGGYYYRNAIRYLGTKECFKQEHLYTLFFKGYPTDVIEKRFFGLIDDRGAKAVEFFSNYILNSQSERFLSDLLRFMDAQKLRTPKGLDYLKAVSGKQTSQAVLAVMRSLWQMHVTIWMEGVWEIVSCRESSTKFIMSDHPVNTYNKNLFSGAKSCRYPFDAEIERIGTHTIFPVDLNHCLIITNLEYVRNPSTNRLRIRENPRYFAQTMFDLRKIQTGRKISEQDILSINYIIKNRAKRYIASPEKEWLYPEKHMAKTLWNKLGSKHFLMPDPRKVSFSTGIFMGNDKGPVWAQDEYGRIPNDNDPQVKKKRDKEWQAFQTAKRSWDSIYGPLDIEELHKYM